MGWNLQMKNKKIWAYPKYALYIVRWSELATARAAFARLASSFLFMGVEKGDFSVMAAAIVAWNKTFGYYIK